MTDILERIQQAKAEKWTTLALNFNQLSQLPSEIGQLTNLSYLYLNSSQLSQLPPEIGQLTNLSELDLSSNQLSQIPPEIGQLTNLSQLSLHFNQLSQLPREIGQLTNLSYLYLDSNQLSQLPREIGQLTNLSQLSLSLNQLSELPREIGQLTNLGILNLSSNQLSELPREIGQLTNLSVLYLHSNQLSQLPPEIGQLTNLSQLYLDSNQLSELPPEIRQLTKLERLDLRGNSLPIPPEILEKIDEPATMLNYYFAEDKKPLNEFKMLLVGQGSVGKTSLINRLLDNHYNPQENKTEGINIRDWKLEINDQTIKVNVWDFGGQEIMHATHQFFLTERSLYLLVLDARLGEEENRLEYWLKIINSHSKSSPIIVIGNKIDQHPLDINRKGLKNEYSNIITFIETSCKENKGIENLKETIINVITTNLKSVHDSLFLTWFNVKAKLEALKKQGLDYTEYSKYEEICKSENITEEKEQKLLIYLLHHLGVILNFQDDPRLNSNNVLNPEWVTNAVYKIINNRDLIIEDKGVLTLKKLTNMLNCERYPTQKHLFIIDMMKKFELCFEMDSDQTYLIPDIIPKEEPETGEWDNSLCFEYHYPVYINSIISRFIVRSKDYIAKKTYWRTGVVLQNKEGNKALIKADREDKKIFIKVKGNESTRRGFLSIIRSQFEVIHKSLPGLEPEIKECIALPEDEKVIISYKYLLQLEQARKETFLPEGYHQDVNVTNLLNGFESESRRQQHQLALDKGTNIYINQNQNNTMSNNNTNKNNSGSGDFTEGDKTSIDLNSPSPTDNEPTKHNTKALKGNTNWVIIGSILTFITIIIGIITTFVIPSINQKPEPSQPSTSTKG